ncbi:MAG: class I SAM-dependent methyltransferase [Planctomycetota bacterium]
MSRKQNILRHYERRIDAYPKNHEVVNWATAASQQIRFEVLCENVPLNGKKLLDVGCGLGDLLEFLKKRKIRTDYTGVDICPEMAAAARRRHRRGKFFCADLFDGFEGHNGSAGQFAERDFDIVFCSGTFNLNLGNNLLFLPRAIGRLMELSNECVAFNLLHDRTPHCSDEPYAYYNPGEVRAMLLPLGWSLRILDDYLPNDFTVICHSPDATH